MSQEIEVLEINGGKPLKGALEVPGAKNATTKLLVASLLSDKKIILKNVPNIEDVAITCKLCEEIGSEISWDKENRIIEIQTKDLKTSYIPQRFSGANRIPILMIGALLGRTDEDIIVPTVGGCKLGPRPINFHISALEKLGAHIEYRQMKTEGAFFAQAHSGLNGSLVTLPYPSVGATENTILAAVRAKGKTVIKNAAIEPEIVDMILFLQKLGAIISFDTNRTITVYGTNQFYEVEHTVLPDRIVAGSFGLAALGTKGKITVTGAIHRDMISLLNKIRQIGGEFCVLGDSIEFSTSNALKGGIHLETDVFPGFATDWQQPFTTLLTQATGSSIIHETVYENRMGFTETLKKMGADIELFSQCLGGKACRFAEQNHQHSATIKGPTPLEGTDISIPDLRAGFAYVMAALIAKGKSTIYNLQYIDRGYEALTEKFQELGAEITRKKIMLPEKQSLDTISSNLSNQLKTHEPLGHL